jgi:flap endonuclease-1
VLVYSAPLLRNLTRRDLPLVSVSARDVCRALRLSHTGFVEFALLLGTDFTPRIRGVGPSRALRFLHAHGSIERVVQAERQFSPPPPPSSSLDAWSAYLESVRAARGVFETLPPVPDDALLRPGAVVDADVVSILQRYGLHRVVVEDGWNYSAALRGNYFDDDPSAW